MSEAPDQKERRMVKQAWPRAGEIVLLVIAAFCALVLLTQDFGLVTRFFYSPLAIILLIVVFVEYLIIKGGDRSRLYLIEIERMREREQEQVVRMRRALEELDRLRAAVTPSGQPASSDPPATNIEEGLKRVEHFLRPDARE